MRDTCSYHLCSLFIVLSPTMWIIFLFMASVYKYVNTHTHTHMNEECKILTWGVQNYVHSTLSWQKSFTICHIYIYIFFQTALTFTLPVGSLCIRKLELKKFLGVTEVLIETFERKILLCQGNSGEEGLGHKHSLPQKIKKQKIQWNKEGAGGAVARQNVWMSVVRSTFTFSNSELKILK